MPPEDFSPETIMERVLEILCKEREISFAILTPDYKVTKTSRNFKLFQSDPEGEIIGAYIFDLFLELVGSESGLDEVQRGTSKTFKLDKVNRAMADGSIAYISLNISPLDVSRPDQGLLLVIEDITHTSTLEQQMVQDRNELRLTRTRLSNANEALQKLNHLKTLFLSIAAHDMRSPLTGIRGYADLAMRTLPEGSDPATKEYLLIVQSLVDTLNRLLTDFLNVDMIEKGTLTIRPEMCDLNGIVQEVSGVMREVARRKNVEIETRVDHSVPAFMADSERIQQVLYNLVSNAIKYTNPGDKVIVETEASEGHNLIRVIDHGPGVPEEDIPMLFDLYHRTESARESKTQGLGLGLFIVKSLVEAHGGTITVESALGKGAVFTAAFPLEIETEPVAGE